MFEALFECPLCRRLFPELCSAQLPCRIFAPIVIVESKKLKAKMELRLDDSYLHPWKTPGPATYRADENKLSYHPKHPEYTIGKSPRFKDSENASVPGPGAHEVRGFDKNGKIILSMYHNIPGGTISKSVDLGDSLAKDFRPSPAEYDNHERDAFGKRAISTGRVTSAVRIGTRPRFQLPNAAIPGPLDYRTNKDAMGSRCYPAGGERSAELARHNCSCSGLQALNLACSMPKQS